MVHCGVVYNGAVWWGVGCSDEWYSAVVKCGGRLGFSEERDGGVE